jgi:hypothetical protein
MKIARHIKPAVAFFNAGGPWNKDLSAPQPADRQPPTHSKPSSVSDYALPSSGLMGYCDSQGTRASEQGC